NTQKVFWDRWLGRNGCPGLEGGAMDPEDHDGFKRPFSSSVMKEIDVLAVRDVFEICYNGIDDDGDGAVDAADNDCFARSCPGENCSSGVDDYGDGCIDCDDVDCATTMACQPEVCDNGVDDNVDVL